MVLESKIKRQTPIREFVIDTNKYRIIIDDVSFDSDEKLLNIPLGTLYHRDENTGVVSRKCGHFSLSGDKFPVDTRSININFEYICVDDAKEITDTIIEVVKSIEDGSYITIDVYSHEVIEMEEKLRKEELEKKLVEEYIAEHGEGGETIIVE